MSAEDRPEEPENTEKTDLSAEADAAQASSSQEPEHTGNEEEIQAKEQSEALPFKDLLAKKQGKVEDLLTHKEALKLSYLDGPVPLPYYENWTLEANRVFSLSVRLRHRRASLTKEQAERMCGPGTAKSPKPAEDKAS